MIDLFDAMKTATQAGDPVAWLAYATAVVVWFLFFEGEDS